MLFLPMVESLPATTRDKCPADVHACTSIVDTLINGRPAALIGLCGWSVCSGARLQHGARVNLKVDEAARSFGDSSLFVAEKARGVVLEAARLIARRAATQ